MFSALVQMCVTVDLFNQAVGLSDNVKF